MASLARALPWIGQCVTRGRLATSGGKSHSWLTPTRWSVTPSAATISVAAGRRETTRMARTATGTACRHCRWPWSCPRGGRRSMPALASLLVALLVGFLIGLDRERSEARKERALFAGVRTFPLIALTGAFSVLLLDVGGRALVLGSFAAVAA